MAPACGVRPQRLRERALFLSCHRLRRRAGPPALARVATLGVPVAAPKFPRFSPNGPPWPSRPSSLKTLPSQSLPAG